MIRCFGFQRIGVEYGNALFNLLKEIVAAVQIDLGPLMSSLQFRQWDRIILKFGQKQVQGLERLLVAQRGRILFPLGLGIVFFGLRLAGHCTRDRVGLLASDGWMSGSAAPDGHCVHIDLSVAEVDDQWLRWTGISDGLKQASVAVAHSGETTG